MAVQVPNGTLVAIATAYTAVKVINSISNATPAVAAFAAGHAITAGMVLRISSGWSRLTDKVAVAGTPASDNIPLTGIDSTLTSIYPAGAGAGSAVVASTFVQLAQILNSTSNGGEQQFLEYQFLEADAQKRIPTFKSASGLTFSVGDDPTLPGYQAVAAANDTRLPQVLRLTLPNGSILYYNAYLSLNKTPSLTVNELMAVEVTASLLAEPTRY